MTTQPFDLDDPQVYDFDLPRDLIAQEPLRERTDARMLVIDRQRGAWEHAHVRDMPDFLKKGDTIVVNDSKVIPARVVGFRAATQGRWEGLFLRQDQQGIAELLCKTRGRPEIGEAFVVQDREGREQDRLILVGHGDKGRMLLRCESGRDWIDLLEQVGRVPLPPYIRDGQMVDEDKNRYQTVYARVAGSVAAPTAGLHFTPALIHRLREQGLTLASLTLHVGTGTFTPIQADRLDQHRMHSEYAEISEASAKRLNLTREEGGRIVAVGTTSVRTLETVAHQHQGRLEAWRGETDIFIRPGHRFQAVDCLVTNFHLPRSTLIVLVSAFAGRELILAAYEEAIRERYRFYSYGDCMLIL